MALFCWVNNRPRAESDLYRAGCSFLVGRAPSSLIWDIITPVPVTSCDSEPIHLLGTIQPVGFLLSMNADWITVRASKNAATYLRIAQTELIGHPAADYVPGDLLHDIRNHLQQAGEAGVVEPLFRRQLHPEGPLFAIAIHRSSPEMVLEFEESAGVPTTAPTALRGIMARVERHHSLPAVFREVARQVRALTGYDRVMVYRFDETGCGEVVGEAVKTGTSSFMGLRYPASDIPIQARALYVRNLTRIIVDTESTPQAVTPPLSPEGRPLDLSMSILRSVSPTHLDYMRNMGVRASMSISVLQGGRLWGLIACHHGAPRHIDLEMRLTAELFGQMFSYLLEVREREEDEIYDARAKEIHDHIAPAFASPGASINTLPDFLSELADYVDADGVGSYSAGEVSLLGLTPTSEEFLQLVGFLNTTAAGRVFATHDLGHVFPPARDYVMRAAGILSIPISRTPRDYIVFFRKEVVQSITWAGQPAKDEMLVTSGIRLSPRTSFDAWREIVQGQSSRWSKRELRAAEALRLTLIELVLRLTDLVQSDRLTAQHRQEFLVAELNHRVRNLLGLVRGIIIQSAASATDVQSLVQSLEKRIQSMGRAHDLLTSTETTSGSMRALLTTEIAVYGEMEQRIVFTGHDVMLQPKAFSAMALIIHELVANARKYGALKDDTGTVSIETGADPIGNVSVAWRENGGPLVSPPTRRGFGTTILEQAIGFEVNGSCRSTYAPGGFCLDVVLPSGTASLVLDVAGPTGLPQENAAEIGTTVPGIVDDDVVRLLKTTLLVEDSLFIVIDTEDLLHNLGAETVLIARSVAEALSILMEHRVSFALLDVNLGPETSLPIARTLQKTNIPFAFGTGYGESIMMPETLETVPIISKPYQAADFLSALRHILPTGVQAPIAPTARGS